MGAKGQPSTNPLTKLSPKVIEWVLEEVGNGKTVISLIRNNPDKLPNFSRLLDYMHTHGYKEAYARAQQKAGDVFAQLAIEAVEQKRRDEEIGKEIKSIDDDVLVSEQGEFGPKFVSHTAKVQRKKCLSDNYKWLAARYKPLTYSENRAIEFKELTQSDDPIEQTKMLKKAFAEKRISSKEYKTLLEAVKIESDIRALTTDLNEIKKTHCEEK